MNIGPLGTYRLPAVVRATYGVETAQQLADQLGVAKLPSRGLSEDAEAAYEALKAGDPAPARSLLVNQFGVSEQRADEALGKLPAL
jgi:hypothetical protein